MDSSLSPVGGSRKELEIRLNLVATLQARAERRLPPPQGGPIRVMYDDGAFESTSDRLNKDSAARFPCILFRIMKPGGAPER
jgi:hypothetical protein